MDEILKILKEKYNITYGVDEILKARSPQTMHNTRRLTKSVYGDKSLFVNGALIFEPQYAYYKNLDEEHIENVCKFFGYVQALKDIYLKEGC